MSLPRLILVGGFLGAGKTTLLAETAIRLSNRGKRVGLVANDQSADLVDTEVFRLTGACVEEVAGGCFCCRFPDMIAALSRLADRDGAEILLGEPVGSCTDLAATVMHPLKDLHTAQFDLAPLSVLVDGGQVRALARLRAESEAARQPFSDNVLYIYEKQLEEANLIVLNKADRLTAAELADLESSLHERFPDKPVMAISALTGDGVDAWLDRVSVAEAAPHVVDVDYDTYAEGEAALGWLNASVVLQSNGAANWRAFAEELLQGIRRELLGLPAEIAHLKLIIRCGGESLIGNITSDSGPISLLGSLNETAGEAAMQLNVRVRVAPAELQELCERVLHTTAGVHYMQCRITSLRSLSPGRPVPTHRYR